LSRHIRARGRYTSRLSGPCFAPRFAGSSIGPTGGSAPGGPSLGGEFPLSPEATADVARPLSSSDYRTAAINPNGIPVDHYSPRFSASALNHFGPARVDHSPAAASSEAGPPARDLRSVWFILLFGSSWPYLDRRLLVHIDVDSRVQLLRDLSSLLHR
jgi:hypothetical protein